MSVGISADRAQEGSRILPRRVSWIGLLRRRERWGLTWRGRIMVLLMMVGSIAFCVWQVHPFLAVTKSVDADLLVVEGWIPDYALKECLAFSRSHSSKQILTVGGPVGGVASACRR